MPECLESTATRLAEPLARALGLALWGVEVIRGGRTTVRVFVDRPRSDAGASGAAGSGPARADDGAPTQAMEPGSASIGQCEELSRQLGLALDVEDCIPEAWVLEVSSPGLDRRFFTLDQLRAHAGDLAEVRMAGAAPGAAGAPALADDALATDLRLSGAAPRRVWRGRILAVDDSGFTLAPCAISAEGEITPEGGEPVRLAWADVRRAARIAVFPRPVRPGKGRGTGTGKTTDRKTARAGRGRS